MKLHALPLVFLFATTNSFSQTTASADLSSIDSQARSLAMGKESLEEFVTAQIIPIGDNDLAKARAIYTWITENIAYDCKKFHNNKPVKYKYASESDREAAILALEQELTEKTLKRGMGVCSDYSRLFKQMCTYAGVECVEIRGYAKIVGTRIGAVPRGINHSWNAFKANGQWYLIDATWGAGYVNPEVTRFTKSFVDRYFMMPPTELIKTHFPEDSQWQLLDDPLSPAEFSEQPHFFRAYWEMGIAGITPEWGRLDSDAITFTLDIPGSGQDPFNLLVIQGDQVIRRGFEKDGNAYSATVELGRQSRVLIARLDGRRWHPVVEYRL